MLVSHLLKIARVASALLKTLPVIVLALVLSWMPASAQTTATIDIDTTATIPVHPRFSGANHEVGFPVEFWDYRFSALAAKVGYGWVRFPGGNDSDTYNWQTGEEVAAWVAQFSGDALGSQLQGNLKNVAGKGGARLIDAANQANLLGATFIVCANGFTDTPQSIGQLAAYAKANNISVAVWELANEAYLFPDFFADATTYLDKMKPYRDAIKAADPNAIVAVFVRDAGNTGTQNSWNAAIAAYPNKYWDAITFHHYPPESSGNFAQWMADESAVLVNKTSTLVTNQLAPIGPPGTKFVVSEFDPSLPVDHTTGVTSITDGTLWGGIYVAEFIMRMSTLPSMLYVGAHAVENLSGVQSTNDHYGDVQTAANRGEPIDTLTLDFGFYLSAQANGLAVLNGVINKAIQSNKTTVTGGATVPATGITGGIPALYAMSYTNASGGLSVMITNKSATPQQVTIRVNGTAATGMFPLQFIAGTDPSMANTPTNQTAVTIQTGSSSNPVTVPPYSVLRADITTPPVATLVSAASYQSGALAPQQLVSAFGSGFASQPIGATSQPLPLTLGDTSIVITDSKGTVSTAPLLYVSPGQANFLMPEGVAPGAATAKVMRSGATVLTGTLNISAAAPGLFAANGNGAGVAAALAARVDATGTTTPLPVLTCQSGVPLSCLSAPLSLGSSTETVYLSLFGTGIRGAGAVQAFLAGQPVSVLFTGPQSQFAGLDQVNISIPRSFAGTGEASAYIVADGKTSNMITVKIQ